MEILIENLIFMENSMNNIFMDNLLENKGTLYLPPGKTERLDKSKIEKLKEWFKNLVKKVIDRIIKLLNDISEFIKKVINKVISVKKSNKIEIKKEIRRVDVDQNLLDTLIDQIDSFISIVDNNSNNVNKVLIGIERSQEFVMQCRDKITKDKVIIDRGSTTTIDEQVNRLTKLLNKINGVCKTCKKVMSNFKQNANLYDTWGKLGLNNYSEAQLLMKKFNSAAQVMSGYTNLLQQISSYIVTEINRSYKGEDLQDVIYVKS